MEYAPVEWMEFFIESTHDEDGGLFKRVFTLKVLLWVVFLLCNQALALPSVAFFYGKQPPILQLCAHDIIVVDPDSNFNPDDCKPISQPIAYVSLGEIPRGVSYEKNIRSEWVIGNNVAWNNNKIIDQTQKEWQTFFINQLIDPLWKKGYRGFFIDTLDSYVLLMVLLI